MNILLMWLYNFDTCCTTSEAKGKLDFKITQLHNFIYIIHLCVNNDICVCSWHHLSYCRS